MVHVRKRLTIQGQEDGERNKVAGSQPDSLTG